MKNLVETLGNGTNVNIQLWKDNSASYLTFFLPQAGLEDKSEQDLIKLVSTLPSFGLVPAEYTRQAGIADAEDENGNPLIELTFVLGNSDIEI